MSVRIFRCIVPAVWITYRPWRAAREAGIEIDRNRPCGVVSRCTSGRVELPAGLDDRQARCAIAVHLIHQNERRACPPAGSAQLARDMSAAARLLAPYEAVARATRSGITGVSCVARSLMITRDMMLVRLADGDLDGLGVESDPPGGAGGICPTCPLKAMVSDLRLDAA